MGGVCALATAHVIPHSCDSCHSWLKEGAIPGPTMLVFLTTNDTNGTNGEKTERIREGKGTRMVIDC